MKRYRRGGHPYHHYHQRSVRIHRRGSRRWRRLVIVGVLMVSTATIAFLYVRPLPLITAQKRVLALPVTPKPTINWPAASNAAFGTLEQGVLASKDTQAVRPTASTIKLLTVLTVLRKKPLKPGEQGPAVILSQRDVDIYNTYYQEGGSLAEVAVGERISERQLLEGILLPSANNYADSLASWAFGSVSQYRVAAQAMANQLGMNHTTVGVDASGFSPTTVSTADDLTLLGIAAIKDPVVAQIVKESQVDLPVAGVKQNINWLLGQDGVVGIKTGNTDEAGGVFVFGATDVVDTSHTIMLVGAIQGEKTVSSAITQGRSLIDQAKPYLHVTTLVHQNQVLATYRAPWGARVHAVAKSDVKAVLWPGSHPKVIVNLEDMEPTVARGSRVGWLKVGDVSTPLMTDATVSGPSWQWRVFGR